MAIKEQELHEELEQEASNVSTPVTATPTMLKEETQQSPLHGRALYAAIAGLMLSMLVSALDQTIVGTAMPRIISDLKGFELISWVTTAYLLTSTASIPILGKLSDIFGRKYILMFGIGIFTVGSALCGASQDINQLIFFRALQGIGSGALLAVIFTIVGDLFSPAERARWQGLFFATFGLASVIGPSVGGWLTDGPGWRWCFYVNIPLELLSIVAVYFTIPASLGRSRKHDNLSGELRRIDFAGSFFSLLFVVPLLLGLVWGGQTYPWGSWQVIGSFIIAAIGLVGFIFAETRAKEPILPLELFKNKVFTVATLLGLLSGAAMFGIILYTPWFVQGVIGANASSSGAVLTPLMLTLVFGSVVVGQIIARIGRYKMFVIAGTAILVIGGVLLAGMGVDTHEWTVTLNIIVVGLGLGLYMPVINLAAQNSLPMNRLASGTSAITFIRSIGQTIGAAIMGTIVTSSFTSYAQSHISTDTVNKVQQGIAALAAKLHLTAAQVKQFDDNVFGVSSLTNPDFRTQSQQALTQILGPQGAQGVHSTLTDALHLAIQNTYFVGIGLSVALLVIAFFLRDMPLRKAAPRNVKGQETSQPLVEPAL